MKSIPVHQLQEKTSTGLEIKVFRSGDTRQSSSDGTGAHRDDHYIFFLLTKGSGALLIELQDIDFSRSFRKTYGMSPSEFRMLSRK